MKRKIYSLLTTALIATSITTASAQCDTSSRYTFMHDGNTYHVVMSKEIHTSARACAQVQGGHLVYIDNQAEQDAVYAGIIAAGVSPTYATVANGGGIAYVWTGANDQSTEGDWQWGFNGTSFWSGQGAAGAGGGSVVGGLYNNWGGTSAGTPNEPDDFMNNQDAAGIALSSWPAGSSSPLGVAGEWNDIDQTEQLYYVVEIENTGVGSTGNINNQLEVYPNPATNAINIKLPANHSKNYTVDLTNAMGQTVKSISADDNATISLDGVSAGTYILNIRSENEVYTEKITVLK